MSETTENQSNKITKVVGTYYVEYPSDAAFGTGLYLKLEDGRVLRHQSTDAVMPFQEPDINSPVRWAIEEKAYETTNE